MKWLLARIRQSERGGALALVAASITLLMGMAAFGTDLAWFYLNSSQIQRAADAAALGGVIHLPGDEPAALNNAIVVATQNGYDDTNPITSVAPTRVSTNQLRVRISHEVPTFFLKVLGFQSQTITEEATAEYIPPLKLGSPTNRFGNDPSCYATNSDCAGNFWANIHGTRTDTGMGDAFSSYCELGDGSNNGCDQSSQWRNTGYLYGVIPGGNAVTVQTLDLNFRYEDAVVNADQHRTGDHNNFCGNFAAGCVGPSIRVNVYEPDPTPLDISDATLACTEVYDPMAQINPDDDPPFDPMQWNYWDDVCGGAIDTSSSPNGIWVVQIVTNDINGDGITEVAFGDRNHSGLNRYSIRTDVGNIFALGDFSIYNNAAGTATSFHLAEVPDFYAGKTFVVELYDAGESADPGILEPVEPSGSVFDLGECRIYSRTITQSDWGPPDKVVPAGTNCQETVSPGEYHGLWLKFEMDLPLSYTCGASCWWRMNYDYPTDMNDTTTWRAYMIGNPIHLIP